MNKLLLSQKIFLAIVLITIALVGKASLDFANDFTERLHDTELPIVGLDKTMQDTIRAADKAMRDKK